MQSSLITLQAVFSFVPGLIMLVMGIKRSSRQFIILGSLLIALSIFLGMSAFRTT